MTEKREGLTINQLAENNALLTTENIKLQQQVNVLTVAYDSLSWILIQEGMEMPGPAPEEITAVKCQWMAEGVDKFADFCGDENSVFVEARAYYRSLPDAAAEFAAQLRVSIDSD